MRLFGTGTVYEPGSPEFDSLFEQHYSKEWKDPGHFNFVRSIIDVKLHLVGQSCGFAVPFMDFKADRPTLVNHLKNKSTDSLMSSCRRDNTLSLDGIPSFLNGTDPSTAASARKPTLSELADRILPWVGGAALGAAIALAATKAALK
ncbi:hypothetical protein GGI13_007492 [Coemansia sp. RSA 455]|nr:hypothetical protein GGI13_007492 [Coemansia sp. RSA 455]